MLVTPQLYISTKLVPQAHRRTDYTTTFCYKSFCDGFSTQMIPKMQRLREWWIRERWLKSFKSNCQISRQALGSDWFERRTHLVMEVGLNTQADWKQAAGAPKIWLIMHTLHYGTAGKDSMRERRRGNRKERNQKKHKTQQLFFQLEWSCRQRE